MQIDKELLCCSRLPTAAETKDAFNNHSGRLFYHYFNRGYIPIKSIKGSSISVAEQ
jgi:hypothetical protein